MQDLTPAEKEILLAAQSQPDDIYGTAAERVVNTMDKANGCPLAQIARFDTLTRLLRKLTPTDLQTLPSQTR